MGCRAPITLEYPDSALYTQLKYFESLFNVERARKKIQARVSGLRETIDVPRFSERHDAVLQKLLTQAEEVRLLSRIAILLKRWVLMEEVLSFCRL